MRKLMMVGLIGMVFCIGKIEVAQDSYASMRPALWRSSSTCATAKFGLISTGTIHLHAISVDSATVNQNNTSIVALFNSTSAPNANTAANFSTGTMIIPDITGGSGAVLSWPPFEYEQKYSSGVFMNKVGNSCITIYWDFITTKVDPIFPWRP